MNVHVGCRVKALVQIAEVGFRGAGEFVHAEQGDLGRIEAADGTTLTVTWERHRTVTDVDVGEVRLLPSLTPPNVS